MKLSNQPTAAHLCGGSEMHDLVGDVELMSDDLQGEGEENISIYLSLSLIPKVSLISRHSN